MRVYQVPSLFTNNWTPQMMPATNLALQNNFSNFNLSNLGNGGQQYPPSNYQPPQPQQNFGQQPQQQQNFGQQPNFGQTPGQNNGQGPYNNNGQGPQNNMGRGPQNNMGQNPYQNN